MKPPSALLYLAPSWFDHGVTQNLDRLRELASALATLTEDILEAGHAELLVTDCIADVFMAEWQWPEDARSGLLGTIHSLLSALINSPAHHTLLYPGAEIDALAGAIDPTPHPVPEGCDGLPATASWAREAGGLLALHDRHRGDLREDFFIGVPCSQAFNGGALTDYPRADPRRSFPLVGPELNGLGSAYHWTLPHGIHRQAVRVEDAERHLPLLGGVLAKKKSGSHRSVTFKGAARSWPLDYNFPEVPEPYLAQLVGLTKRPLGFIKATLITGRLPERGDLRLPGDYLRAGS